MNPYITYALIFWTLVCNLIFYCEVGYHVRRGRPWRAGTSALLSFLSLFTALLAIGHYIN